MKHIAAYQTPEIFCGHLNHIFEGTEEIFNNLFSIENISKEAELLNRAEESIPEDLKFNLEIDLILKRNNSTSDYNKGLAESKNLLFDMAESHLNEGELADLKSSMKELFEGFKNIKGQSKEAILEQLSTAIDNADSLKRGPNNIDDMLGNIKSTTDMSGIVSTEGGWFGMIKKLFNAITEGGSAIGILHLVLDVVGLLGDFFSPVGMIADILNGLIYMVRGKWVLATISFIAAMLPFAGNIFAGIFKAGSKTGAEVMKVATVMGKTGTKVSDDAVKLLAKSSPESIKALDYMAKSSKKVMPGLRGIISGFFRDFIGKLVSWLPVIGKPLQKFFNSIAKLFDGYAAKTLKFSDDVTKAMAKVATHTLDDFFKAAAKPGTEIVAGTISKNIGKEATAGAAGLLVKDVSGKVVAELPAAFIKNSDHIAKRWGGVLGKETLETMGKNSDSIVDLYTSIAKVNKAGSEAMGLVNRLGDKVVKGFIVRKQLPMFFGKQIYKLFAGMDYMGALSDSEYESIGNVAISETMQEIMDKNLKENPNQAYDVPYVDAITNVEGQEVLQEALQTNAESFGLPGVAHLTYYTSGTKDKIPSDVAKFFKDIETEDPSVVETFKNMDVWSKGGMNYQNESISIDTKLKHITPF